MTTPTASLDERRRQRSASRKDVWECSFCGSRQFLLAIDGDVLCYICNRQITDLSTNPGFDFGQTPGGSK
jgi:hypothetical protein